MGRGSVGAGMVLALLPTAMAAETGVDDRAAVIQVVQDAYVDGIHNFRDPAAIRGGFHPEFEMLILREDRLEKLPLADWIARIEAQNAKQPPPSRADGTRTTTAEFPVVEIAGSAALCRVELYRDGQRVFTDFLNLYRFSDGWRIVGKSFYRHP